MADHGKYKVNFSLTGPIVNKFIGREMELQQLKEFFLSETSSITRRKVFIVHGLGGIGKTQLSVEFARRYHTRFSSMFWLDGSSKDALKQSFVGMAQRLPQEDVTRDAMEVLKHPPIDLKIVVSDCLRWLSLPSNRHWFLIFDNIDRDYDKKNDRQSYKVEDYFPPADHGSILITTRLTNLQHLGNDLQVGLIEDDQQARNILENAARQRIEGRAISKSYHRNKANNIDRF